MRSGNDVNNSPMAVDSSNNRIIDVWLSLPIYFIGHILSVYALAPLILESFQSLPQELIWLTSNMLPLLLLFLFYLFRWGPIQKSDWRMKGKDFIALFLAFIILFIFVATIQLTGGGKSAVVERINRLDGNSYLAAAFLIILLGPFLEEVVFRKFIFNILHSKYNIYFSLFGAVILNTLIHVPSNLASFILYFVYALFFTTVYINSGLSVSLIVHSSLNFFSIHLS
jgi:membrane protease YdiL (CAAX protease family)